MISAFSTQHKFQSKRDETLLLQTDLSKANTVIPKPIQWKDVNLPEEWILEGIAPPAIPKQLEPNTELQNVTQYSDGKVKLSFRRSNSTRFSDKESSSSIPSLERKFTKIPSVINLPFQSQPRFSTSDIPNPSIRSVDYSTKVPHPIYISSQHEQRQEEKEPSPPTSPTFSAVTENVINVIEKHFELNKTLLHNDFYSENNEEKRLWFFEHFLNQRKEIQQIYYEFVSLHQVHILFFDWFEIYSSDNNISYPFKESSPITIRKKVPEWKLSDSDRTIESEHPPLRSLTVDHGEPPVQIRASPYKIPKPNDTDANLSSVIQQNNFCNTNLNTIGKQLARIENQFQQSTIAVSHISKPIPSKSDYDKKLKEPIFKPFQVSKTSQKLVQESKSDFAKAIREQLDRIEVASSSSSKVQIAPDTPQSSKIGVLEHDQISIASSDLEAFTEEPIPKANKIHWELALPTSKSPPDLTIDNMPSALNQSRYNASSVYEWNIDGMSEYNILGVLQQMTMAANAYKTQSGTSDKAIAEILIAGFTGQLKGWWDHLLTKLQQLDFLNAIQSDENGAPILDESNNPIQDAVTTLILTISLHFIGDPSHLRDKNAELLHNLRCRKLSEFQSYKTNFFTRLFIRDDANHVTWKEKFLAGLPTLLGEKVRNSIKALYDNRVPYDELTYEEWILEGNSPPAVPKQLEPNTELQNVTQYSDGKVKLSFRRSNSTRFSDKESSSSITSLERKFTKIPSVINLPFQSQPRKKTTEWKLSDSDRIIESEHPPLRSLTVDHGEPPVQIRASPYKIPKPNDTDANLSSVIQQNNFCNTNLNTIGKQLARIENQFQQSTISVSPIPKPIPSKSDFDKKLKEPIFKPFQVSKTSQRLVQESKSDFAKAIREQLDRIEAASSSSSKVQIAPDTPQSSKIGVLNLDQVSIASSDLEAFTEEPVPKANKIHWELALPTSKSPPDLTIDNRPSALNQSRYNASSVYEWNIDGMSEYNILGVLQQMTMAANAYKTQSGTSDKAIAEILIAGFTGQLKGWWDHLLTKLQQLDILNAIQSDENSAPILDELNNPIQDAVTTLILTISLHFIGDPSHLRDKNAELLHNLRCRKLSEFQSYKTNFFTRLFLRDDANHVTWKEKFLAGLPTLLGEKVRNSIKALYDNRVPYDELTYGELVSFVNKEGLKICQDLKLQKRLKWELKKSKQELGSFCKQFNYDPFKTSTSKDCNGECSSRPYKKRYKSKNYSRKKPFHEFRKLPYKKPSRPYKKPSFSKKKEFKAKPKTPFNYREAICHKCGMKGHTARYCRMNRRLQELDLNEDILSKIAPLLVESSDSESSMSGDSDPF
ncbi:hypothetical protein KPL71_025947 [Citrus sinensis]|uniref:Uncharacterized protein n=1 Tax=Citrus sinensis TaxID=2711 RepID=A0ACB8HW38_CITSI|nr:hypothetical protein KPL71_025947 [Citrus sinensis]